MDIDLQALENWFKKQLADETGLKENEIDLGAPIGNYKLDSLSLVSISFELEKYLGMPIDPTIFGEFETVNEIIQWVSKKQRR